MDLRDVADQVDPGDPRTALLPDQSTFDAVLDRPASEPTERVDRRPADA